MCTTLSHVGVWVYSSSHYKPRHWVEVSDGLTLRSLYASGERSVGGSWRWSGRFGGTKNLFSLARFELQYLGCPARTYSLFKATLADVPLAADTVQKLLRHLLSRRHVTSAFAVRSSWSCGRCDA